MRPSAKPTPDEEALRLAEKTDGGVGESEGGALAIKMGRHVKRLLAEKAEANERRAETVAACDLLRPENERHHALLDWFRDALKQVETAGGCGDNSCPFGKRGGMGTNGGCHCPTGRGPLMGYLGGIIRKIREAVTT